MIPVSDPYSLNTRCDHLLTLVFNLNLKFSEFEDCFYLLPCPSMLYNNSKSYYFLTPNMYQIPFCISLYPPVDSRKITLSIPSTCHSAFTPANVPSISQSSNFSHSHGSTHKCDFTKVTAFKKQPSFGSYAPLVITYFSPPISRIISLKKIK